MPMRVIYSWWWQCRDDERMKIVRDARIVESNKVNDGDRMIGVYNIVKCTR